ncbi:hypothetical protein [Acinetobacter schindleri]|uniref:hypothetical protein n=1 Tax=Acinetobacter schindleri TaxID=108981 RepID=UPI00289BA606|nr:hypothetical protein [Acinetobacter schindleri]
MDFQKEKEAYLGELLERDVITQDEFRDLVFKPEINAFDSNYLSSRFIHKINFGWSAWQAKAQAVPEWKDYTIESPRIDGPYQIFIMNQQLVAKWESSWGFSSIEDGDALNQELITHWSVLGNDPAIEPQEPANV